MRPEKSTTLAHSQRVRIPGERSPSHLPRGTTAFGVFLIFGTTMALLAATTLLLPGTPLDRVWKLNPRAHEELTPFGKIAAFGFALLAAALALAAFGLFRRRLWGWRLAVALHCRPSCGKSRQPLSWTHSRRRCRNHDRRCSPRLSSEATDPRSLSYEGQPTG
jgi:hypothetical protein